MKQCLETVTCKIIEIFKIFKPGKKKHFGGVYDSAFKIGYLNDL